MKRFQCDYSIKALIFTEISESHDIPYNPWNENKSRWITSLFVTESLSWTVPRWRDEMSRWSASDCRELLASIRNIW